MHKLNQIGLGVLFVFLLGCENGILEETPDTFQSEAQVFETELGVETALNGLYYAFSEQDYHGAAFHNLLMPVSGKFWSSQNANRDATGLNCGSSNISLVQLWSQTYQVINEANLIIANLENSGTGLSNRDAVLGQTYFLRAVTYFDLVRIFGDVPLRTEPIDLSSLHLPRTDKAEVYARIIADLELARDLLPDLPGRPRPMAATAYLAKVYLTRGTAEGNSSFLEQARTEALAVVSSDVYQLTPTYSALFDPSNENTSESIFELQYGHTGGVRISDFSRIYTPGGSIYSLPNVPTFGRVRPNKETFDEHAETYAGDPRIDATFLYNEYQKNGARRTIYPLRSRGNDGYAVLRKYFDETYNGTTTQRNMILMRYADVLLMLAEIENELNGPAAAYAYVNQVMARARNTEDGPTAQPADYADLSQEAFRDKIRTERRFELLGEGHVWFDTRRYGYDYLRNEVITPHNEQPNFDASKDYVYPDDPKNMLLPIPLTELSGNSAIDIGDQNPGY
jgi:hypothetical protein